MDTIAYLERFLLAKRVYLIRNFIFKFLLTKFKFPCIVSVKLQINENMIKFTLKRRVRF